PKADSSRDLQYNKRVYVVCVCHTASWFAVRLAAPILPPLKSIAANGSTFCQRTLPECGSALVPLNPAMACRSEFALGTVGVAPVASPGHNRSPISVNRAPDGTLASAVIDS